MRLNVNNGDKNDGYVSLGFKDTVCLPACLPAYLSSKVAINLNRSFTYQDENKWKANDERELDEPQTENVRLSKYNYLLKYFQPIKIKLQGMDCASYASCHVMLCSVLSKVECEMAMKPSRRILKVTL